MTLNDIPKEARNKIKTTFIRVFVVSRGWAYTFINQTYLQINHFAKSVIIGMNFIFVDFINV